MQATAIYKDARKMMDKQREKEWNQAIFGNHHIMNRCNNMSLERLLNPNTVLYPHMLFPNQPPAKPSNALDK